MLEIVRPFITVAISRGKNHLKEEQFWFTVLEYLGGVALDEICRCGLGPMPGSVFSAPYELSATPVSCLPVLVLPAMMVPKL